MFRIVRLLLPACAACSLLAACATHGTPEPMYGGDAVVENGGSGPAPAQDRHTQDSERAAPDKRW